MCRVGRVATFLPLLLILSASTSNADITLKAYLDLRESPQVREKLRTYFTGVGRGIFWSNAVLNARGAQPLFCMPDKLALDEGIIQSVLDQEIRAPSEGSPYTGDTPVTDYAVGERGQSERALWGPALDRHIALFDRAPQLAVAMAALPRGPMNAPRRTAGSGTSCCRGSRARSALALPAQPSAGARGAKAGSVRLSAVMGSGGAGTAARAGCSAGSGSASSPITCWCSAAPGHESRETSDGPPSARCMEQIRK